MRIEFSDQERDALIARWGLPEGTTTDQVSDLIVTAVSEGPAGIAARRIAETDTRQRADRANDPVLRRATADARRRYDRSSPAQPVDAEGEQLISAAVAAGKFPASRTDHYRRRFARDPQGTADLIGRMAPVELGNPELWAEAGQADDAYPAEWLRSSDAAQRRRNRVTSGE